MQKCAKGGKNAPFWFIKMGYKMGYRFRGRAPFFFLLCLFLFSAMKPAINQAFVDRATVGAYSLGQGLRLVVRKSGRKYYYYRYQRNKKVTDLCISPCDLMTLEEARNVAGKFSDWLIQGIDPKDEFTAVTREANDEPLENPLNITFGAFWMEAIAHIESLKRWQNEKHASQWVNTVREYAVPTLEKIPLSMITLADVVRVLSPIWLTKTETASRLRGRLESIFDVAIARGLADHNPARWKAGIDAFLPPPAKVATKRHMPAMPIESVPSFVQALKDYEGDAGLILLFGILTAVRPREYTGARWDEIDLEARVWEIPAERMKMKRPHRVPLSTHAVALLEGLPRVNAFVFPSRFKRDAPRSPEAGKTVFKYRPEYSGFTCHGFRSTFRDWCAESLIHPDLAEKALAHDSRSQVVRAYQRSDLLEQRRPIMQAWGDYVFSLGNWLTKKGD